MRRGGGEEEEGEEEVWLAHCGGLVVCCARWAWWLRCGLEVEVLERARWKCGFAQCVWMVVRCDGGVCLMKMRGPQEGEIVARGFVTLMLCLGCGGVSWL